MAKTEVTEYLKKIGSKGGKTTKAKHGADHYKKIGKLGAEKRYGKSLAKKK